MIEMNFTCSVAASSLYCLACLGYGWLVVPPVAPGARGLTGKGSAAFEYVALGSAFLLGTAIFAAILIVLGITGQLLPSVLATSLAPGLIVFAVVALRCRGGWSTFLGSVGALRRQPWWIGTMAVLLILLALGFAFAAWFAPPKGDAAAFYLVYPKIIAAAGALIPMPGTYEGFSQIGLSAEYHFAALMVLADVSAAKLFIFPVALANAAMLCGLVGASRGGPTAMVLACAMLLTSSTVHIYMFDGKVDLLATGFGLAAVYWLVVGGDDERGYLSFALSGLFAGLAIVAKFSFIPSLGASLLVLLIWRSARRSQGQGFTAFLRILAVSGIIMGLTTLIGWLPQLLKNAVLFQAPLAPFIGGNEEGEYLNQVWFSVETTWRIVLTYPLALIYGRYPMQGGGLSFLFLCFLPLLLLARGKLGSHTGVSGVLAMAGIAGVIAWVVLRPSVIAPRYILASLLLLVPYFVVRIEQLLRDRDRPAFLEFGIAISVLAAIGASSWQLLPLASGVAAAYKGADRTCIGASVECVPLRQLSEGAAPEDRILVATYYAFWLDASHLQCRDQGRELSTAVAAPDLEVWLQQRGFRYAVVDTTVFPELAAKLEALKGGSIEAMSEGTVATYRIQAGAEPAISCVNAGRDHWILKANQS
ncbi:hypothetical protein [Hoeflea sp.]|uniref:hypothetical protein n=1 Tax=Hoeflea sp. TaxID=1940281 RepID=UPI003A8D9ACD